MALLVTLAFERSIRNPKDYVHFMVPLMARWSVQSHVPPVIFLCRRQIQSEPSRLILRGFVSCGYPGVVIPWAVGEA